MTSPWKVLGTPFVPSGQGGWMNSHAQVPTPLYLDGVLRVFFASRPEPGLSLTTYAELDSKDPSRVTHLCKKPILVPGPPGTFDQFGIMPSCAVVREGDVYLYYSGWARTQGVPYHNTTGLAISVDGGRSFTRAYQGPVMDRTYLEPFSATSPFVLQDDSGLWHIFYSSGTQWISMHDKFEHVYDMKHGISSDGVAWRRAGEVAIPQNDPLEAVTRPWIYRHKGMFVMWYCVRGSSDFRKGSDGYRLHVAVSENLRDWRMIGHPGALTPPMNSQSTMQAYPSLVVVEDTVLFFTNESGFGAKGFVVSAIALNDFHELLEIMFSESAQ